MNWDHLKVWQTETDIKKCVRRLFEILDTKEMSDEGKVWSPVYISSCRVVRTEELNYLLPRMKELAKEIKDNE